MFSMVHEDVGVTWGRSYHSRWYEINIIVEHISARHWITDNESGIGSCMYVCMYVHVCRPVMLLQLQLRRMHYGNYWYICICVCMSACTAAYTPGLYYVQVR